MRRQQNTFAQNWWSQAWLTSIEAEDPPRMQRGKAYARKGKVELLEVSASQGQVKAQVRGSRRNPYTVEFSFAPFNAQTKEQLEKLLQSQTGLLAHGLPSDWEQLLQSQGQTILPDLLTEMSFYCSCPDWSIPCKHTMAAACLLAAKMDAEADLLLQLRGISLKALQLPVNEPNPSQALETTLHQFWGLPLQESELLLPKDTAAPVLQQLGAMPGGMVARRRLKEALEPVYHNSQKMGADLLSALLTAPKPPASL